VSQLSDAVRTGYYARSQIFSRSRLIAWSHRGRFATGLAMVREVGGARVLDFGCGDGTFLALLLDGASKKALGSGLTARGPDGGSQAGLPVEAIGAEIDASIVDGCRQRFEGQGALRFMLVSDLDRAEEQGRYDAIYCMEVLEHVVDPVPLLDQFHGLLAPGGTLVISVPIEIGLPVVVKQVVRRVAGWRGVEHYPGTTGYRPSELVRSIVAGATQHIVRPIHARADGSRFCDHKGFNWRVLRTRVRERFVSVRESTSPVAWLGPHLGTQRWLIARKGP
jgi:2-polyprenyl-3-methyl-5-hydroxy-6-metoxy-1,4-benzoquinol methylase